MYFPDVEIIEKYDSDTLAIRENIENNSYDVADCATVKELVAIGKTYT